MENTKKKRKKFGYEEAVEYFKKDKYCLATTEYNRKQLLKTLYNLSIDDYFEILKSQNNVCAICKKPETTIDSRTNKIKNLSVDHHHESGRIRGLLCQKCNSGLGMFLDDVQLLESAIDYLKNN